MDSRKTTRGDRDEPDTENVVRLPRDWLGPRDELVPMGSRARSAETPQDASAEPLPPTAASFWGEDSGFLHAPMQAPADARQGGGEAVPPGPAALPPSAATRRYRSLRPRLPGTPGGGHASRRRGGTTTVAGLIAACVLLVAAVIGETEGGTRRAGEKTGSSSKSAAITPAPGVKRARLRAQTDVVTEIKIEPTTRRAVRSRARNHRTHISNPRRQRERSVPEQPVTTSQADHTPATYAPTPTATAPPSGSTPSSPAASTAGSPSSSGQQQPAFGASGSLGPGSSPDS